MANRRMFSKDVVDSDKFLDMPPTAQNLYFHLGVHADDDGFVSSPKKVQRSATASNDDLTTLVTKNFIIPFESGVIVITDWNINNQLRKDRRKETIYQEEKSKLVLLENQRYQCTKALKEAATNCQPSDNQTEPECPPSIVEYSVVKSSREEDRLEQEKSVSQSSVNEKNDPLGELIVYYSQNVSPLTPVNITDLEYDLKDFNGDLELMKEAVNICARKNKRNYSFFRGILKNWRANGIDSHLKYIDSEKEREEQRNKQPIDQEPKMPDYSVPDEYKNQFADLPDPDFEMPY